MKYALVGDVAKNRGLKGEMEVPDIINAFTAVSSLPVYNGKAPAGVAEKRKAIYKCIVHVQRDLYARPEKVREALDYLSAEFILAGSDYRELSDEILGLERVIAYDIGEMPVPVFAQARFADLEPWEHEVQFKGQRYTFRARHPPIPSKIIDKAKMAVRELYDGYTQAMDFPILAEHLLREHEPISLWTYWIPKPGELVVTKKVMEEDRDPLLIAEVCGRDFLIDTWVVESEQPFQHYLMEYLK